MAGPDPSQTVITRGSASRLRFGGVKARASTITFFWADVAVARVNNPTRATSRNNPMWRGSCLNIYNSFYGVTRLFESAQSKIQWPTGLILNLAVDRKIEGMAVDFQNQ